MKPLNVNFPGMLALLPGIRTASLLMRAVARGIRSMSVFIFAPARYTRKLIGRLRASFFLKTYRFAVMTMSFLRIMALVMGSFAVSTTEIACTTWEQPEAPVVVDGVTIQQELYTRGDLGISVYQTQNGLLVQYTDPDLGPQQKAVIPNGLNQYLYGGSDCTITLLPDGSLRIVTPYTDPTSAQTGRQTSIVKVNRQVVVKTSFPNNDYYAVEYTDSKTGLPDYLSEIQDDNGTLYSVFMHTDGTTPFQAANGQTERTPVQTTTGADGSTTYTFQDVHGGTGTVTVKEAPKYPGISASPNAGGIQTVAQALQVKADIRDVAKANGPKLIASMVHWFGGGNNSHYNLYGHDPATNPSITYHPLGGLFDSSSLAYNRWIVKMLKAAGIDGVSVDYYGGTVEQDPWVQTLLDVAQQEGNFTVTLMFELRVSNGNVELLRQQLEDMLDTFGAHPAFQRLGGVDVLQIFGWGRFQRMGTRRRSRKRKMTGTPSP